MPRVTYEAVQKQIAKLQAQAKSLEAAKDARKLRAVDRVRALMKKLGVELSDLGAAPRAKARGPVPKGRKPAAGKARKSGGIVPPKYRDPESGATWTGRGRTPVWMAKKLAEGRTREEFAISAGATK
jgi:DNA-binding protein H-NS